MWEVPGISRFYMKEAFEILKIYTKKEPGHYGAFSNGEKRELSHLCLIKKFLHSQTTRTLFEIQQRSDCIKRTLHSFLAL